MKFNDDKIENFYHKISAFIPSERLYTNELWTLAWGADAGFYREIPQIVVFPLTEEEVSRILQAADELGVALTFRASGTSLSGQASTNSVLVVVGLNWERYEVLDGGKRIRLQPGVMGGRVNEILAKYGYKFPPDPASINSARIGGIVANNASGMNCGVHANSERVMTSARLIFTDGTILDVGDERSREDFAKKKPDFIRRLLEIRDEVRSDPELVELIKRKYLIKNVTGLNLRPLVYYDDPFTLISRLIVGSEGTLAFLSEVTTTTEKLPKRRASAMIYANTLFDACRAVLLLKKTPVISAEVLDRLALKSVQDDEGVPDFVKNLGPEACSVLLETTGDTEEELQSHIDLIKAALGDFPLLYPVEFTEDPKVYGAWWAMRSGVFPKVGGQREVGSTCLIEDVAFPLDVLPEATAELQKLISKYGYEDGVIYGHALEGNFHFVLNQRFDSDAEVQRYNDLMLEVVSLVVDKYHGSLKAEHGTGRNMAPFVEREWGSKAFAVMKKLKTLFDPNNILNPGVIFNSDPECHLKDFKPLPETHPLVDKCIECGFCEPNCLSCGLALSSRQRVVVRREISRLRRDGSDPARLERLLKAYKKPGIVMCAGDGLCSTSCPMEIDVGDLTHVLREEAIPEGGVAMKIGVFCGDHLKSVKSGLRPILGLARFGRSILGAKGTTLAGKALHKIGLPLWTPALPGPYKLSPSKTPHAEFIPLSALTDARVPEASEEARGKLDAHDVNRVVYFPSCINQTMGSSGSEEPLIETTVRLLEKAGFTVVFPPDYENLCCGTIWESKGMPDVADRKTKELEDSLWAASNGGEYPILCDQSPCLYRMRAKITKMKLYEPVEFIETFLVNKLDFHPSDERIAVHSTCSSRKLNLTESLVRLANRCSSNVLLPEEVGCCGFAGDKGFTHPEINAYALRKLKPQIDESRAVAGYSTSRTCEIGLTNNSGVPYMSIIHLVDQSTTAKK